jgi:hypothetical protein
LEVRYRQAEFCNIRRAPCDARRDFVTTKEPDTHESGRPLGDVDTAVVVAQSFAIVVWSRSVVCHASASRIVVRSAVTISICKQTGLSRTSDGTIRVGVHGDGIRQAGVYTLDDI